MADKYPAWCPGCNERDVEADGTPCANCGFPSFWPHQYPNCYTPATKPTVAEVRETAMAIAGPFGLAPLVAEVPDEDIILSYTEATSTAVVPQVHIDDNEFYWCIECGSRHKYTSKVGKAHLGHRE